MRNLFKEGDASTTPTQLLQLTDGADPAAEWQKNRKEFLRDLVQIKSFIDSDLADKPEYKPQLAQLDKVTLQVSRAETKADVQTHCTELRSLASKLSNEPFYKTQAAERTKELEARCRETMGKEIVVRDGGWGKFTQALFDRSLKPAASK